MNFDSLLIFSENPKKLVDFYKKVFEGKPAWTGGDFVGYKVGKGYVMIGPHDKVHGKAKEPERLIYNLEVKDVKKEFARVKKLGAKVVAEPYHPDEDKDSKFMLCTFADPDGNFFQLASPMK
jgi:predicted enzyme related to lactoylglutathione lyase